MTVPPVTDWAWLGTQRLEEVARKAVQSSEPATWLKEAYAWSYSRLDAQRQSRLPRPIAAPRGPSQGMIPVLGASLAGAGCLGFVSVRFSPTASAPPPDDTHFAAYQAAKAVGDAFRRLEHDLGHPYVELVLKQAGGASVGLSAVIAALVSLLSLAPYEDFAATGCFDPEQGLLPVEPATLTAKLEAARQWGYRRLLVADGQTGIPSECGLEIVEIPRNLIYALFTILRQITPSPDSHALARILAVFDQAAVRADPRDQDLDRTLQVTQDFVNPNAPELVRHVAHDIRSRALLHVGRTEEAAEEKEQADAARPAPLEFPAGWLGDYLKWHQVAHHTVLAIDQGRWDHGEPEHDLLDRTLERLLGAISDRQAGPEELLAALFLSNTRGRRLDFLGRWHRDSDLLCRAWDDLTRFRPLWPGLFDYCRQIGLRDSDLHRQENCCLDVLASYWHMKGHVPDSWSEIGHTFWPEGPSIDVEQLGPFDLANLLRWKAISGQEVGVDLLDRILKTACGTFERAQGAYPFFLVYETVLRYKLGNESQQREAAERMTCSSFFSPELPETSILSLLAMRSGCILDQCGYSHAIPVEPKPGTELWSRRQNLQAMPELLIDRCPY